MLEVGLGEGREPFDAHLAAEHGLEARLAILLSPLGLLVLERFDLRLVGEYGRHLRAKHDNGEYAEERGLEAEQYEQDERRGRRVRVALGPFALRAPIHVRSDQQDDVHGRQEYVKLQIRIHMLFNSLIRFHFSQFTATRFVAFFSFAYRKKNEELLIELAHTVIDP